MNIKISGQDVDLWALISVTTVVAMLLSYYNTYMLYNFFGISITSFLDPSEIIFSFSGFFVGIVTFGMQYSIYSVVIGALKTRFPKLAASKWFVFAHAILLGVLYGILPAIFDTAHIRTGHSVLLVGVALLLYARNIGFGLKVGAIVVSLLLLGLFDGERHYKAIVSGEAEYYVELKTAEHYLKSDSSFIYIGKTNHYVFFWNSKVNEARAYKTDDLQWISMKRNRLYVP